MNIAFFDFDGTITRKDTMLELAKFHVGSAGYYLKMLSIAPSLVGLKLKVVSATQAKEQFLKSFFGGMKHADFDALCYRFNEEVVPNLIRPDALETLRMHQELGDRIVVVTASAENWVQPWCKQNNLEILATQLDFSSGTFQGKLSSPNCNGAEKVNRILSLIDPKEYEGIYAYGDSIGDKELLAFATQPYYRKFVG